MKNAIVAKITGWIAHTRMKKLDCVRDFRENSHPRKMSLPTRAGAP